MKIREWSFDLKESVATYSFDPATSIRMPIKFVNRYKTSFQVIVEAGEGFLLGGRTVSTGPVFNTFFHALGHMNAVIESNVKAKRSVRLGKVVEFRGMGSSGVLMPDRRNPDAT